ncbi:ATP-grasp fold amidoligase family protein [Aestuariibaculum suncheonense]|uniref:Glycosyl transferase n=1 Tax=Aestuariibaculum suncheonense TaxID=1028745 RepID=A0A8J6Q3K0_9FLAO|nr:ATP-grasp fold amidoligase family protein [Aestuariibaculum suncheonense]MBD0833809.1 glycosyl transferase [Aestuariibaculum suncheonense]
MKDIYNFYKKRKRSFFIKPLIFGYNLFRYKIISEKLFILLEYKKIFGVYPNLESPKLFTEKIQWLKLYDKNPLYTKCADKYEVREYVKEKIGEKHLIPLILVTENVEDIAAENLPNYPVIIKTNHDSGGGIIVRQKNNVNYKEIHKLLKKRLSKNYYNLNREWEYKDIKPKIIVEKLMSDESGNTLLNDYKIFCFNGKPRYIQTLLDRETGVKEDWYDINWNRQEFRYFSEESKEIERPKELDLMLKLSERLASDFKFVRVDLYKVKDEIYFGELTFKPYSGLMIWNPRQWDFELGSQLDLKISKGEK